MQFLAVMGAMLSSYALAVIWQYSKDTEKEIAKLHERINQLELALKPPVRYDD